MTAIAPHRAASRLRGIVLRGAAVLSAFVLAACEPGAGALTGPSTGQMIDPRQPVPVALLVPGGSANADLNWLSRSLTNSARMAVNDAQGATIDLRIYETNGDNPATAVARANEAADAGAKIIIGPLFAESANAVGNAMQGRDVNVLSFSNNADIAGGNVFVLGNTFANVADRLVGYGVRQNKRRVLMVAENDVAGRVGAHAIERAVARNGATLAGRVTHPVSQQGIDGVTPQIAQAVQSGRVDAVFMTANNQAVLPYLTEKLVAAGVTGQVTQFMGLTRWDEPASRLQLPTLENGWFAIPDTSLSGQFNNRYRAAYGEPSHALGSLAYDGVSAVAALVRAGRRDALTTRGLTSSAGFNGVNGVFRLLPDGSNQRALAVATIRGGQVVILEPAPRGFGRSGS
ncbi:MAG: penicillin-binding protein activator [Paracoccus sp. (in: a-proteobacteria)]|uniref:penicillin-binding protein activator n=1 Tax=Paracoccus sp. TaxID=267 RepID=UPI0026DFD289|nr:penicillin-binding protein activator [Paracoccus sp. (in: a-proteobacteria)]MDO5631952.1 penicillin-binding protein activator [Paracoccus sp. (in: a-proteobacteria)]